MIAYGPRSTVLCQCRDAARQQSLTSTLAIFRHRPGLHLQADLRRRGAAALFLPLRLTEELAPPQPRVVQTADA